MKKLIMTTVGLAVAVIITAAVLMPVLDDSMATSDKFTNEGYYRMSHYDDTTNHTLSWDHTDPNYVTVDDVKINISGTALSVTVVADTNWIVRSNSDSSGNITGLSLILPTGGTNTASVTNEKDLTITFTSGSMSALLGTDTRTGTYANLWIPSLNGDLVMKPADKDAYIKGDSPIVAYGLTRVKNNAGSTTSSPGFGISMIGSYDDGLTTTLWRENENNNSIKDETINVVKDSKHTDLYKVSSITATFVLEEIINDEAVYTETPITYNYFIVPYQVTAERAVHLDPAEIGILAAIPIIVIISILMLAVSIIGRNRE